MTASIIELDSRRPHKVYIVDCSCGGHHIAVAPIEVRELQCHLCGEMTTSFKEHARED